MKITTLWLIVLAIACTLTAGALGQTASAAPIESVIYSFCPGGGWCGGGAVPVGGLIADSAGNLYGTTFYGGAGVGGVAFKVTPKGDESLLYTFTRASYGGWGSESTLTMDKQGNLYGTTDMGGTNSYHVPRGDGTAFKLSPDGTETTLYNFGADSTDGVAPVGGLVRDDQGTLYGTTYIGGVYTWGTVFRITPDGVETVLHNFNYGTADGGNPWASLVIDNNGNLYGTTQFGGYQKDVLGGGTVFEVTADGTYEVLHIFNTQGDGVDPTASLTLDRQGNLYGTTYLSNGANGAGTVFKLSPGSNGSWNETILYNFNSQAGTCQNPASNVLFDAKGNLYGTTRNGGAWGGGCAYKISPAGKLTILHAFGEGVDGASPIGNLVFSQGNLYGTTDAGGAYAEGAVFKITP